MRSRDLRHWETSSGKALELPVNIRTAEIVDPVPAKGGLLNSNVRLAFDRQGRPVISRYHKYDAAGACRSAMHSLQRERVAGRAGERLDVAMGVQRRREYRYRSACVFPVEVGPEGLRRAV